jgi:hypothetical protein
MGFAVGFSIGGGVLLVKDDEGNAVRDLADLRSGGDDYGWLGVVEDICQKLRWVCEFKDEEGAACAQCCETCYHVVGAPGQKHANEAVAADSVLS